MVGCARSVVLAFVFVVGCARHHPGAVGNVDSGDLSDACSGLACFQFDCVSKGLDPTSVSGFVYAPNGTLPLYGVNVYVPSADPGPLVDGATCARCDQGLQGGSLAQTVTDETGHFSLQNVPATANVPVVIQVGKWRRQLNIPTIAACQDLPIVTADTTLPKSMTDMTPNTTGVDMPRIAISTGALDALECLPRKLGIADKEIGNAGSTARIQLFSDFASVGAGVGSFATGWAGGTGSFADSQNLWNPTTPHTGGVDTMKAYDIMILSCEGISSNQSSPGTKPQAAMDAVKAYADLGGRIFLSHWHNVWIEGLAQNQKPAVWAPTTFGGTDGVAAWNNNGPDFNDPPDTSDPGDTIDETNNPKGVSFATWMLNVTPGTTRDSIAISEGRQTALSVDDTKTERWVYWNHGTNPVVQYPQNFQFTTPNEVPADQRCGKVVFSDMHVSSGSTSGAGNPYPGGCATTPMTPQEKALAFMFFDISSCVGSIF